MKDIIELLEERLKDLEQNGSVVVEAGKLATYIEKTARGNNKNRK